MANLLSDPIQAIKGDDGSPLPGQLALAESAKDNVDPINEKGAQDLNWVWLGGTTIDGARWNKSYPYQLIILQRAGSGYAATGYQFTLPIPPQDMTISTPFAITTTVTLGGIIEEHNGAPIKMISFSGTTGVQPLRGITGTMGQKGLAQAIFAGTIDAIQNTALAVQDSLGSPQQTPNLMTDANASGTGSGYYQFRLLQRFLESYVNLKKNGQNDLRLGLAMWKDQAIYLVTPAAFDVRRSSQSPWEYNYQLSFRAWRRVVVGGAPDAIPAFTPVNRDPNAFAQVLNILQAAQSAMEGVRDILEAIRSDVDTLLFEPMRETILFCKDAQGAALTAADLPASIASDLKEAVLGTPEVVSQLDPQVNLHSSPIHGQGLVDASTASGKSVTGSGRGPDARGVLQGAHPVNAIFDDPSRSFSLMSQIPLAKLNLAPTIQAKITAERERVRLLNRLSFETMRDNLVEFASIFADAVGAGSAQYDSTYNRSASAATKVPTADDFDVLFALNDAILQTNKLAASTSINTNQMSTMEAVAGMASASGIAFKVPTSKFAVPFPYGSTVEQLALQYLGDANRWHEIVTLNGLRTPYVDEEGFDLPLLTNGRKNQVIVADATNLFIGQPVWISSSTTSRSKRRIIDIDDVSQGNVIITVDGDQDLERFTTLGSSTLHAYLPDTVNSQMLIYIPSDSAPTEDDFGTKDIPGVNDFDQFLAAGGVDLLLTPDGDLVVTPDGDCRLAVGLTNLVQRVKLAIGTPRGSLIQHPDYGCGLVPGASTADVDPSQIKTQLRNLFASDPTFTSVQGVSIAKAGPVVRIQMSVGIAGVNQKIPISVDVKR